MREGRSSLLSIFFTIIGTCMVLLILIVVSGPSLPHLMGAKSRVRRSACTNNAKQLSSTFLMYSQDWDNRLPLANSWYDGAMPHLKSAQVFVCPARPAVVNGYAFNAVLDGARSDWVADPAMQPLVFESFLGAKNGSDPLQSFLTPHNGMGVVAYLDGHVQWAASAPLAGNPPTPPPGKRFKKEPRHRSAR